MKKILKINLAVFVAAGVITGFAFASVSEVSHSLKSGTTAFTVKALKPKKAILFPESQNVRTSYSTICIKNNIVSHLSRSFNTSYTRNLLYKIAPRQDVCYFTVAAATNKKIGQIVIDIK